MTGYFRRVEDEQVLAGGNTSGEVVRVGRTVRKPWTAATPAVLDFMAAVHQAGVDVPAALGRDEQGRQVTEFIPGRLALGAAALTRPELHRVGALVRSIHDASETFTPAGGAQWSTAIPAPGDDLICHNDLAPWNLIIGERWVFVDWDAAAPSTRLWDLAYAAQAFTLSDVDQDPTHAAAGLAAFADGYRASHDLRAELPETMHRRSRAMYDLLSSSHSSGLQPWGQMFAAGHGTHWHRVTDYTQRHQSLWLRALLPTTQ